MTILHLVTILATGLLIGSELSVSAFINPVVWKLDERATVAAFRLFAGLLGRVMPFWYAACFILLIAETFVSPGHGANRTLLLTADILWAAVIFFSIAVLVPINNRIAALQLSTSFNDWRPQHHRWETLHRVRIAVLLVAFVLLLLAILP